MRVILSIAAAGILFACNARAGDATFTYSLQKAQQAEKEGNVAGAKAIYDAAGRTTIQTQQDGSKLQWCYNGVSGDGQSNCLANKSSKTTAAWVDLSDEDGNHWQKATDGLGRLVAVMEPNAR